MDKNAIKKYAAWARTELIDRVTQKAAQYGIEKNNIVDAATDSIHGKLLTPTEKKQRQALIAQIKQKDFDQVMEEVAYTWFNRFVALRFMEVNGYLPSHVRVFTDDANEFNPQILAEAINLEIDGIDMEKVYALKDANNDDELFKYLIIVQCNALSALLPRMFQRIDDYTELLFPDNLLRNGSVIHRMITDIKEVDWTEQVEILGWMYQYYISDKHDQIVNINKGAVKKEDIPAATQLFTTDWVVRYMVDNSLGRYWIERHPESILADKLEFFVKPKNGEITYIKENVTPQEMTFFDPCMGSGHILVYAFDVLMEIYRECGYTDREAVAEIVQNNLYGLDIDERCSQLAYFAVMMKARSYDRRFLTKGIEPHVLSIRESNALGTFTHKSFMPDKTQNDLGEYLIDLFRHAKEIGSLKIAKAADYEGFQAYLETLADEAALDMELALWQTEEMPIMAQLAEQAKILSKKYAVVCTNPPYMGKYDGNLKDYVLSEYKPYSGDLFSVFIYHNFLFCKPAGYLGFMTPFVWMSIQTYEKLREYIVENKSIVSLIQFEYSAFEEATVPICSFVLQNSTSDCPGAYFRLSDFRGGMEVQRKKYLEALNNRDCGWYYETYSSNFPRIKGTPITSYWATEKVYEAYSSTNLDEIAKPRHGLATSDNARFLKLWFEVDVNKASLHERCMLDRKWFPMNKGGSFRKWYGNLEWVINYENDGKELKDFAISIYKCSTRTIQNTQFYFKESLTWSALTSGAFSVRWSEEGALFGSGGYSAFVDPDKIYYVLALMNSKVNSVFIKIVSPTLNYEVGHIKTIPVVIDKEQHLVVDGLVESNISISRADWDSFETSWDFQRHPLIPQLSIGRECVFVDSDGKLGSISLTSIRLSDEFDRWQAECDDRFHQLKANEEELNRIFIDIYGLQDELTPEVEDKDVTVRMADLGRDIRSFISYAVGCMFGRYSLDEPGLAYAGGEWDASKYVTFPADKDNIIPICDDEYFEDDIVGRFVKFVEAVYGADTLDENLRFIADALGGKGQSKDVIRNYFLNDFFNDHCKIYQKRPIYWQFDSGKKNGFKCLIYMHRYQPDTIARIRTDYVHEQQSRYRTAIADLEQRIASASTSERVKMSKRLKTLQEQATEIQGYEEKIHHLADQYIAIDLDDGVKVNYAKFQDVLAKIK